MSKVAKVRTIVSQRSLSHQSRLPASTNFLKVFRLFDPLAFEYPSHYLWDDQQVEMRGQESAGGCDRDGIPPWFPVRYKTDWRGSCGESSPSTSRLGSI